MKVAQVISSMGEESSGVQSYLWGICNALEDAGVETTLYTCGVAREMDRRFGLKTYPRLAFPMGSLARSPELKKALCDEVKNYDVIQSNGLWQLPNVYPAVAVRKSSVKLVTMPHGTLSKWALARSSWKKRLFGWLGQTTALARTNMFIATSPKEATEIRECGYRQPIAIIPIGMDIFSIRSEKNANTYGQNRVRKVGFLGRIHKVKGIENLVRAWKQVGQDSVWELVIAGPDGGARKELESMILNDGIRYVHFVGELHGEGKYDFLRDLDVCVLPSYTENFGITVAEALACGTPVIASKGTPWEGLVKEKCGWWINIGVEPLGIALKEAMKLSDDERIEMGRRGRNWIERDFSWSSVANKMISAYSWLLHGGNRPNHVIVSERR